MSSLSVALLWLALIGLVVLVVWALYRQPPQVSLSRDLPHSGFEGARLPLTVRLKVRAALPTRLVLEDEPPRTVVPDAIPVIQANVWGEAETQASGSLTLNRRGVYAWPGARLHWADPLGLFWRSVPVTVPTQVEVYPGTHGLLLPDLLRPLLSEGQLSRTLGLEDPISLRGAREYAAGDPPGRIHWRMTARTGTLTVRELERTAASSLTVYLDLAGATEVFVESAVRLAASLVQEAQNLGLPMAIATQDAVTPAGTGFEHRRAALVALARAQATAGPPRIPPTRSGGNLIILTQRAGPELVQQATAARATASRVSVVAVPEGFYLEPGETPRRQWVAAPDTVRELERQAGALAGAGVLVFVLRGNQSVLRLST